MKSLRSIKEPLGLYKKLYFVIKSYIFCFLCIVNAFAYFSKKLTKSEMDQLLRNYNGL